VGMAPGERPGWISVSRTLEAPLRVRTLSVALLAAAGPSVASAQLVSVPVVRTTLEATGDVGRYNDAVTRPDGTALVAYTGAGAAALRAASCHDAACTSATSVAVDTDGPFAHVAAAIGADGSPVLVYQHALSAAVRLALCGDAACTSAVVRTVATPGGLLSGVAVAVGGDGLPVAVYGASTETGVTVAHCDDAACNTFTRTAYPANQSGREPAAVAGSDGLVVFAARDGIDVTVSHCATAACTSASTVRLVGTLTPEVQMTYGRPSLALGANGLVEIATESSSVFGPFAAVLVSHRRCADVGCASIALDGAIFEFGFTPGLAVLADGIPVAAHRDGGGSLRLTRCRNADCGERDLIQLDGSPTGPQVSAAVTAGEVVLVSYYDSVDGDLEVAAVPPYPYVSIATPAPVVEGNAGTTPATFQVTRTGSLASAFTVSFATAQGTATAGTDFLPVSGTLTFAAGELERTVQVAVVGDLAFEQDETFSLRLSNASGAVLLAANGLETIQNDDPVPPPITISDTSVVEGDLGGATAVFQVTFAGANGASVNFATAPVTATAGVDYVTTSGVVTFAPGETVRTIEVPVIGDDLVEPDERFRVRLSGAQGGMIQVFDGFATIVNDDVSLPQIAIGDAALPEGDAGLADATFTLTLDASTLQPVTLQYATEGITAGSGVDFLASSGTVTFPPGVTVRTVAIPVVGELDVEPDETFRVVLSNPRGAAVSDGVGIGTIANDDVPEPPLVALAHGVAFQGTLAVNAGPAADVDDFRFAQAPFQSYEVVLDAVSGDAVPVVLERRDAAGSVVQSGTAVGTGTARSLRWRVSGTTAVNDQTIRVAGACGTACGDDDAYRVRAYETTLRASRFNDAGGQVTLLVLQNAGDAPVALDVHVWGPGGELLATHTPAGPVAPRAVLVLDTSQLVPGSNGSLTVAHDAPYGGLAGKAVSLEPATGFSFDTPLEPLPR
jgi:hypothetical protein